MRCARCFGEHETNAASHDGLIVVWVRQHAVVVFRFNVIYGFTLAISSSSLLHVAPILNNIFKGIHHQEYFISGMCDSLGGQSLGILINSVHLCNSVSGTFIPSFKASATMATGKIERRPLFSQWSATMFRAKPKCFRVWATCYYFLRQYILTEL